LPPKLAQEVAVSARAVNVKVRIGRKKMAKKSKKAKPKQAPLGKLASEVMPEKTDWVWENRIAKGCVTVIAGDPGVGKSQIAATLAATVTRGGNWPCGEGSAPEGDVVMLIGEDDMAKRIKPLLMAADANVARVRLVGDHGNPNYKRINLFDAKSRYGVGDEIACLKNPQLLIIDPIGAFVDAGVNNANAAREVFAELTRGAKHYDIAIVLICHLTKSGARNALSMIAGSSAIAAAARAIYLATNGEPGSKWKILACVKNNLAPPNIALQYRIKRARVEGGITTSRVAWNKNTLQMTADEALAKARVNGSKPTQQRPVDELVKGLLADGKRAANEIFVKGEHSGFTPRQLGAAAKRLAVMKTNTGYGPSKKWFWELPAPAKKPS
jgi:putative DNA primase/helicase